MELKYFDRKVVDFISGLDRSTTTKALRTLDLLEKFGSELRMPYSKKISTDLFELRVRGKKEVRILYCFCKKSIIVLHAFIKKSQKIPKRHIALAVKRLNSIDYV